MTVRQGFSIVLLWISIPLGIASLGYSIYFGIDVAKIWLAPKEQPKAPLTTDAHPIEVVARAAGGALEVLNKVGDGIVKGLFALSLCVLAVAVVLFFISRQLRVGSS